MRDGRGHVRTVSFQEELLSFSRKPARQKAKENGAAEEAWGACYQSNLWTPGTLVDLVLPPESTSHLREAGAGHVAAGLALTESEYIKRDKENRTHHLAPVSTLAEDPAFKPAVGWVVAAVVAFITQRCGRISFGHTTYHTAVWTGIHSFSTRTRKDIVIPQKAYLLMLLKSVV